MNIEQVNEALAEYDGTQYLIPRDAMQTVVEAARRFVDGWETCPTCNGSGLEANHGQGFTCDGACCPTCANEHGMIPGPELVERVATILADHDTMDLVNTDRLKEALAAYKRYTNPSKKHLAIIVKAARLLARQDDPDTYLPLAKAVLRASRQGDTYGK